MPPTTRALFAAAVLFGALFPSGAAAQASPYLPLDDPRLPLLEHLIARADVADPSPMVRPFRRADAVRVLAEAGDTGGAAALVRGLRGELEEGAGERRWGVAARAGVQGYTDLRRDPLHPAGGDGIRPYAEFAGEAAFGSFVLRSRPALEPRLTDDPEWPGRRDLELSWRFPEAYAAVQLEYLTVFYGQMDRNWGPVGVAGIGVSDYAYPQTELAFELGTRTVRLSGLARSLEDERDAAGERVHRYFFAHRLGVQLSDRLTLALWETTVLAGVDRDFDARYRNPLTLLLLANQYGLGSDGNVLLGLDAQWRPGRGTLVEAQLALDDLQYENTTGPERYPNRWALTVAGSGPLGARLAWRALYTQASSLAFRTLNPFENFTTGGVGLGRNFADQDQLTVTVTVPGGTRWLFTPELTLLRQGEGRINDPFPASDAEAGALPQLFIGTVERTWRAALGISGWHGPLQLRATAGVHHIVNAGHEEGRTVNRFEGRLQATLGLGRRGVLR
ncbi:MAG TPA: hypothetical protein VFZ26_19335 [Gemmatimonadales bacterium]